MVVAGGDTSGGCEARAEHAANGCAIERARDVEHKAGQAGHGVWMAHERTGARLLVNGNHRARVQR